MTKKEIVKAISEEMGLTQLKTKEIVQKTFDAIIETLVEDRRIELRNFGVFEVKMRAARKARNPRTGGQVEVPAKFVVTFKPGKEMEEKVRLLEEQEAARRAGLKTPTVPRSTLPGSGSPMPTPAVSSSAVSGSPLTSSATPPAAQTDPLKFARREAAGANLSTAPADSAARETL